MLNRNLIHLIVHVAILVVMSSAGIMEYSGSTVAAFTPEIYAEGEVPPVVIIEEDEEIQEDKEEKAEEEEKENNTDLGNLEDTNRVVPIEKSTENHQKDYADVLKIHNQGGYIKKEALNQEYIDKLMKNKGEKIAYLTFDDGPSPKITTDILRILKEEGVTATFFVLGKNAEEHPHILRQIHEDGHRIANHTYSHNYNKIYRNPDAYIEDLVRWETAIKSIIGEDYETTLTRFPGGSFGKNKETFRRRINAEGYVYVDWNCLNGDGEGLVKSEGYLINRFKSTAGNKDSLIILMHDTVGKTTTVKTLPKIVKELKKAGYQFKPLPTHIETEMTRDYSVKVYRQ